ncbi:MAG: hypothetical protein D6775_09425 [Caldilineae bacterium]|nr:MAG: hypothetical protein D6775_09425 [Caldilineae bacterium]
MNVTVRLTDDRYRTYPFGVIGVGTPLTIFLESELVFYADYAAPAGWCRRIGDVQPLQLTQLTQDRYAFCGRVRDLYSDRTTSDTCHHVLLDCTLPLNLIVAELEPRRQIASPAAPFAVGDLLTGIVHLTPLWEDVSVPPVGEPVQAVVRRIERLVMRPGPGFASYRSESELPHPELAPDQVYLTLDISTSPLSFRTDGAR